MTSIDCYIQLISERNRREVDAYGKIVETGQEWIRRCKVLEKKNSQLSRQLLSTRQIENDGSNIEVIALQKKIQYLQEELIKKNKDHASVATTQLCSALEFHEIEKDLHSSKNRILELDKEVSTNKEIINQRNEAISSLEGEILVIQEEMHRVKKMLEVCEEENRILLTDNRKLVKQMLEEKQKLMEELNRMNSLVESSNLEGISLVSAENSTETQEVASIGGSCILPSSPIHAIKAHATEINSLLFSSSNSMILTASSDSTVRIWDAHSLQARAELKGGGQPIMGVDINEDGDLVAGSSSDRVCRIWSTSTGRIRHTLTGHNGKVYAAKFMLEGKNLITGSTDRSIKMWDLSRGYCIKTLSCRSTCNSIAVKVGRQAVSAHQDGIIRFWDARIPSSINGFQELTISEGHQITSVAFSRDGLCVLTNCRDNKLRIIDTRTLQVVKYFSCLDYRTGFNWSKASISPDNRYVASGSGDGSVMVWDAHTSDLKASLTKHGGAVSCVTWNQSGKKVATCDKNGYLIVWN